ncbi:trypsin-like peptidase domain-containing protein [Crateriforma spongiae]|uniref:trypsin-like peptidase domain-containing protein n=1 Tax=Crateriforma spongiae TaxID=2724528 RepID=UPI0014464D97|nr:trypsin-like peptidase domain-containing protein [Crateriforma spongiae]
MRLILRNSLPAGVHSAISAPLLAVVVLMLADGNTTDAQGTSPAAQRLQFQTAMASSVRDACDPLWQSVVTVQPIGTADSAGNEVRADAPTTGIIVDGDGYILTSNLVTKANAASLLIRLDDGSRHAAEVVATDHHRNLVLLKIDTDQPLIPADLSSPPTMQVGQTTIAMGRYGSDGSPLVSTGILSALSRLEGIAIQTDARVSPSFYGGPLIDLTGRILGIVIPAVAVGGAEEETSWYDAGIAFAIPARVITEKLKRLKSGEDIRKGLLGLVPKTKDPYDSDTALASVRLRSPAEQAGLIAGDVVTKVAGRDVQRFQQIKEALGPYDAGDTIDVSVRRDDQVVDVQIQLADSIPPLQPQRLGIIASSPADQSGSDQDDAQSQGVIVDDVIPNSPAAKTFQVGDRIVAAGKIDDIDIETLRRLVVTASPDQPTTFKVMRQPDADQSDAAPLELSVQTNSVAGPITGKTPTSWASDWKDADWSTEPLKLPDVPNAAVVLAPSVGESATGRPLGLFVALQQPGDPPPEKAIETWNEAAKQSGVVVCVVAAESDQGWKPKEIDLIDRIAAAVIKRTGVASTAVAIGSVSGAIGGDAGPADAMALAAGLSLVHRFGGIALSDKTRPPAIRVKENDPETAVHVLLPISDDDSLPTWGTALRRAGYAIINAKPLDRAGLLRWVRQLQAI